MGRLILGCMLFAATAKAGAGVRPVTIAIQDAHVVPAATLNLAELTATQIFSAIGVPLKWRDDSTTPSSPGDALTVAIQFDTAVPEGFHAGALAYATPYATSGTSIHVLIGRVCDNSSPRMTGAVLGHVIAHELAHVLEAACLHSPFGIMKASWSSRDRSQMAFQPLSFDPLDAALIRAGVERRMRSGLPVPRR